MGERRPVGALERAVLECLWSADAALTTREVLERIDSDLAYTTVVTILTRLTAKGLVERRKHGRTFLYRVTMTEADVLAARMRETLAAAGDPDATLSRFAASLTPHEADALQQVLAGMKRRRR